MDTPTVIHVSWTIDCEATQPGINDPQLGRAAVEGFAGVIQQAGLKATLFVIPSDAVAYPDLLGDLHKQGFEIGLHYHPQACGYEDFCGAYTADQQRKMYTDAIKAFSDVLGFAPKTFRPGSCSANDATLVVLAELGFESCSISCPGRNMTHLRSNWVDAPQHVHYANSANRLLEGGLDVVEVPLTTDPDSMIWSGGHPQDLRVELFDAKNQRYMIDKMLGREKQRSQPVKAIVALTHNLFRYEDANNFRTQTMKQMIADFAELAQKHEVNLVPATIGDIAAAYRRAVPFTT